MLIVVRHGQTAANADGLLLGRADPPLTVLGRAQAKAIAEALPSVGLVVASPLQRARQTAACFGVPVEVDERWTELDYGDFDGRPLSDVPATLWDTWRSDPAFAPPGGESLAALGRRVREACDDLRSRAAGGNVVVVTHVSPVKAALAWALDAGDDLAWRMFVAVASISRIAVTARGPVLHSFNEVGHLPPAV